MRGIGSYRFRPQKGACRAGARREASASVGGHDSPDSPDTSHPATTGLRHWPCRASNGAAIDSQVARKRPKIGLSVRALWATSIILRHGLPRLRTIRLFAKPLFSRGLRGMRAGSVTWFGARIAKRLPRGPATPAPRHSDATLVAARWLAWRVGPDRSKAAATYAALVTKGTANHGTTVG